MNAPVLDTQQVTPGSRVAVHAVFGLSILIYLVVFRTTLWRLVDIWASDGTFQYGFLILPISLFLVWSRRGELVALPFKPCLAGVGLVAAASMLWVLGSLDGVQLVQQFAVIAMLPSLVLAVYGGKVVRALLFPLAYLFFAFPWPVGNLILVLQHFTAAFAVRALQLSGFVVFLNGVLIETPVAIWHVAVACSGIKFFLAMIALGLLYVHLFFRSMKRRVLFVLLSFIIPVLANGLRVYFTVVIGEVFGVQYATGTDHLIFGWQFFGTVLLLYFLAGWPWHEAPPPADEEHIPAVEGVGDKRRVPVMVAILSVLALLLGPVLGWGLGAAAGVPSMPPMPPSRIGAWQASLPKADLLGVRFMNADRQVTTTYTDGSHRINLVTADYLGHPRHGHKLLMVGNHWYDPTVWSASGAQRLRVPVQGQAHPLVVHQVILTAQGRQRLVWRWYEVGGRTASGMLQLKWLQLEDAILARPVSTRMVVLSTPLGSDRLAAKSLLEGFMRHYIADVGASTSRVQATQ